MKMPLTKTAVIAKFGRKIITITARMAIMMKGDKGGQNSPGIIIIGYMNKYDQRLKLESLAKLLIITLPIISAFIFWVQKLCGFSRHIVPNEITQCASQLLWN